MSESSLHVATEGVR